MRLLACVLFLLPSFASAQSAGARVYVDQDDPFAGYFSAGVNKKKVPVTLTADSKAAFTAKFSGDSDPGSLAKGIASAVMVGVYNTGASEQVSLTVIDTKTKNIVFSDTCKKTGGRMQAVAECLAKHWKSHIQDQ